MPDFTLYSYFRSSCSARLRIALNLKNLNYDLVPVNLLKGEQLSESHRALNPSASVPLLVCHNTPSASSSSSSSSSSSDSHPFKITQSVAALEYLEEAHPSTPALLPSDPRARATARSLALTVACDIQPVTNLRVARRVRHLGAGDAQVDEWMRGLMAEGLAAYETLVASSAGTYSVGDDVSIADCCLAPAVWNARRYGVDLSPFPVIHRIMAQLEELPAVKKAGYFVQPDTPESLRGKAD
ncbi:maleylacetoacetate isomerase [Sodiomyces alkalinus F11]|uniref:Maleylacetoacetate isomerase n=1 Tax=Sodiomyces alkalinus (strain CBS 110278 / VKM F-3762 / F11) TaxID=1314773 RepID=A0A3N2PU59_SODAK|nr:maleylacetoacetate isomerase [Sodiomyces alkalinus F11]ROT38053.1 maleylacetoacetate isomerase [Sodiomyces alkalinus F11]